MTELVRSFLRKRNKSSKMVHYCYIIIGTEFKEKKNILEQDELFCCVIVSSGLKEGKKKNVCPFLLLENLRPLSPPWEPQTSFSSSGTPDFLSTSLRIDSLRYRVMAINVQFSRSVMSNSLRPHELQHIRLPCPSPTPGTFSKSSPSSQWCHRCELIQILININL